MKRNIYTGLGILFLLVTWLFVGVFRDDEFYEPYWFTKYKPTFKVMFYSPIGMQDLALEDLTTDKQMEEIAFQKFVIEQRRQNNENAKFWYLPFILIQLTLTFLTFGLVASSRRVDHKRWMLPVHLAINLIVTSVTLAFILSFDNVVCTIVAMVVILFTNYATTRVWTGGNEVRVVDP